MYYIYINIFGLLYTNLLKDTFSILYCISLYIDSCMTNQKFLDFGSYRMYCHKITDRKLQQVWLKDKKNLHIFFGSVLSVTLAVSEINLANKRISNHAVNRDLKKPADKQTYPSFRRVVRQPAVPYEILPGVPTK